MSDYKPLTRISSKAGGSLGWEQEGIPHILDTPYTCSCSSIDYVIHTVTRGPSSQDNDDFLYEMLLDPVAHFNSSGEKSHKTVVDSPGHLAYVLLWYELCWLKKRKRLPRCHLLKLNRSIQRRYKLTNHATRLTVADWIRMRQRKVCFIVLMIYFSQIPPFRLNSIRTRRLIR